MRLSTLLSPEVWELLERLRPHLDVAIELFDPALAPLLPFRDDPVARQVRELMTTGPAPAVRERIEVALRLGQHQVVSADDIVLAVFPIRHDRTVTGLLTLGQVARAAAAEPDPSPSSPGSGAGAVPSHLVERLGWSLRNTLEADVATRTKLDDEERRSRWLAMILRFLEHLHASLDERDLVTTLVEGAAIWGDVDARVYRRDLGGAFVLDVALPSVAREDEPHRLPAALVTTHAGATRVSSIPELEQLGWPAGIRELLILPVPGVEPPRFVLTVGGAIDGEFERVLMVACGTLAACLDRLARNQADALRDRLRERLATCRLRFPAPATALLADVAAATGASHARLLLRETAGGRPRTLASVGGSVVAQLPAQFPETGNSCRPDRLVLSMSIAEGVPAWLDLGTAAKSGFTLSCLALADAGARFLESWLAGASHALARVDHLADSMGASGFEVRMREELERARRFDLEAGLLLVGLSQPADQHHAMALSPIIEAMRSQLRASDLLGRLSTGDLAALLVQTTASGTGAVARRVQERLARLSGETDLPAAILGIASFPTAGETAAALIGAALEDLARRRDAADPCGTAGPDREATG